MNVQQRKETNFSSAFEQVMTDPKSDLFEFIDLKEKELFGYSKRLDAKEFIMERMLKDIVDLQAIYKKMTDLKLYPIWVDIENLIRYYRDTESDGLRLIIPFVENAKPQRLIFLDLGSK
jgi:hypothetical protein